MTPQQELELLRKEVAELRTALQTIKYITDNSTVALGAATLCGRLGRIAQRASEALRR